MKSFQSTLSISQYETEIIEIIEKSDTPIFIDTNLIAWSFRLNGAAFEQLNVWLSKLASNHRLFIPQWVVHEYNQ
ncbi:MAG TPA: hypothetical protein PL074_09520, partial [Thermoflexales bacterium]|nr:hypothetical protein [Thermoflexales bacterium]